MEPNGRGANDHQTVPRKHGNHKPQDSRQHNVCCPHAGSETSSGSNGSQGRMQAGLHCAASQHGVHRPHVDTMQHACWYGSSFSFPDASKRDDSKCCSIFVLSPGAPARNSQIILLPAVIAAREASKRGNVDKYTYVFVRHPTSWGFVPRSWPANQNSVSEGTNTLAKLSKSCCPPSPASRPQRIYIHLH
jgi:hypothetical protein